MILVTILKHKLVKLKSIFKKYGNFIVLRALLHKYFFFSKKNVKEITIVITSSGRLEYLKRTVESLKMSFLEDNYNLYIIDDNPISIETKEYILSQNFDLTIFNSNNPLGSSTFLANSLPIGFNTSLLILGKSTILIFPISSSLIKDLFINNFGR